MKICVAGGAGFIGSKLVTELASRGHEVTVVDLLWFGNYLDSSTKVVQKDIFDIDATFLTGFDQVIFVAGVSNDPMAEYSPQVNYIYNAAAPAYLAYAAKKAGVRRLIYASSCSVYGNRGEELSTEEEEARSLYPYGISKLQGEMAVMGMQDGEFSVISLRQGTVCGFSPRMRFDLVINTMYMKAMTDGVITVDNPDVWRPILAIDDAVGAYIKAVEAPIEVSGIFNVSSFNTTVGQIGNTVRDHLQKKGKKVELVINHAKNFRNYRVSTKKAEEVLGVRFKGSIETILEQLDANLPANTNFNDEQYYNIKIFKKIMDVSKLLLNKNAT